MRMRLSSAFGRLIIDVVSAALKVNEHINLMFAKRFECFFFGQFPFGIVDVFNTPRFKEIKSPGDGANGPNAESGAAAAAEEKGKCDNHQNGEEQIPEKGAAVAYKFHGSGPYYGAK